MIWFTLALFAVSFILTALLAPKPDIENARQEDLDPDNFPKATEDAPIPLLLGCATIAGPNTIWYGNYSANPIKEKVQSGLFSTTKVIVGYEYYLSIDLALCLGPNVGLKSITIDDVVVNEGTQYYPTILLDILYTDVNLQYSTSSYNYETYDLATLLSISSAQLITELAAGNLKVRYEWDFEAEKTPVAGGGASPGAYIFDVGFGATAAHSTDLTPPEGLNSEDSVLSGATIAMKHLVEEVTIPVGTTSLRYGAQWSPSLLLFTSIDPAPAGGEQYLQIYQEGVTLEAISSDIDEPELYGGEKSGGGHVGDFNFYPGNFDQIVDSHVESIVGSGDVPAYRGVCHIVLINNYIGESPQLRKMEFELFRYTNNLENGLGGRIVSGGTDIEPAEALYEILTNDWSALSISADDIDIDSFKAASATLISEGNGVSVVVSSPSDGRRVITEILRQIDGIMYQDGPSGKIVLKLIRNDYVVGDLPIYDEDDIIGIRSFNKTAWGDVKSQVRVSFASRTKDSNIIALAQNMATANMIGTMNSVDISFPFCYDEDTANKLASRELAVLSTPLFRATVEMNRNGYALVPGDVIKISWSEYGLSEVVMRVQKIDVGELLDNKVVVDLIQDIFSVSTTVMAAPEDSLWVTPRVSPETIATNQVVDMPYFYGSRLQFPTPIGNDDVIFFPVEPKAASTSFSVVSGTTTGTLDIEEPNQVSYPISGVLSADYLRTAGFATGAHSAGFTLTGVGGGDGAPGAATTALIRSGEGGVVYANGEWFAYEGVTDNGSGSYTFDTVYRGLLGTRPRDHTSGDRVYLFTVDLLGQGVKANQFASGDTIYYKALDHIGDLGRSPTNETELSTTIGNLYDRPVRPRFVKIDAADRQEDPTFVTRASVSVSWISSNRDASQVTFENDTTETPAETETYDVEVWLDGVKDVSLSLTSVSSPQSIDLTSTTENAGEFRIYAHRTADDVLSADYAFIEFTFGEFMLTSGDMQSGTDHIILSGDMTDGDDKLKVSGT